ncbi:MAG: aldo/keto reductase [Pseudomonadota bacterium]
MNINKTFDLGGEHTVNRLGFGAMRLTDQPGNFGPYPKWDEGIALLRHAADLGVQFFDSAYAYGPGWADRLIGEALEARRDGLVIATKGGVAKPAPNQIVIDGSPAALNAQIDASLVNLKTDRIDLFQLHRVDPNVAIEESIGAIDDARREGKVRMIGVSNVNRDQLDRALNTAPIVSVQNRFNSSETADADLVEYTASLGIAFLPYGPLGAHPMRQGAALPALEALKWLLEKSPNVIVIPGTTSLKHLQENVRALDHI